MSGSVRISRDIFDDAAFKPEVLTEREAFIWMIMEASFKDREKRIGNTELSLKRGQLAASVRFMANAWRWDESRVRRFLARLKNRRSIAAANDAGVTVVTICKYDEYQSSEKQTAAPKKHKSPQQHRGDDANENKGAIREVVEPIGPTISEPTQFEELQQVLDDDHAKAVIAHRQTFKGKFTPYAAKLLAAEFSKCPDPNAAADEMIRNGWQGFKPEWVKGRSQRQGALPPNVPSASYGLAALEELQADIRRSRNEPDTFDHEDGGKILGFEPRYRAL